MEIGENINTELCSKLLKDEYATDNWKEENILRAVFLNMAQVMTEALEKHTSRTNQT